MPQAGQNFIPDVDCEGVIGAACMGWVGAPVSLIEKNAMIWTMKATNITIKPTKKTIVSKAPTK